MLSNQVDHDDDEYDYDNSDGDGDAGGGSGDGGGDDTHHPSSVRSNNAQQSSWSRWLWW